MTRRSCTNGSEVLEVRCPKYHTCGFTSGNTSCYADYTQCKHNQTATLAKQAAEMGAPGAGIKISPDTFRYAVGGRHLPP